MAVHVAPTIVDRYRAFARSIWPWRPQSESVRHCEACSGAQREQHPTGEMERYLDWRIAHNSEETLLCLYYGADGSFHGESAFDGGVSRIVAARAGLVESATRHRAHFVVMAHNHPGGEPVPSKQDVLATRQVHRLYAALGMALADHVIVARGGSFSFRRAGLL